MLIRLALFCLVVILAVLAFSPVVQSGNEIHILFDFDLLLLVFTGEGDPTALTARYLDWYPNVGVLRIVVSVVLACVAVYMSWKVKDPDPEPGTLGTGQCSQGVVDGGALEVVDAPADDMAPAAEAETAPVLLLPDRSRSPAVVSSPAAGGDVLGTGHEPSDHPRRRDRGAGRLREAE